MNVLYQISIVPDSALHPGTGIVEYGNGREPEWFFRLLTSLGLLGWSILLSTSAPTKPVAHRLGSALVNLTLTIKLVTNM